MLALSAADRLGNTLQDEVAMNAIRKLCTADEHGTIHVDMPVARPHQQIELVLVWQDAERGGQDAWPSGWFEATAGTLTDPTFVRPPEGRYEPRDGLD